MEPTEYLTPKQLAKLIGRAEGTLGNDRYLRRGIPYIKIGHKCLYRRSDVEAYLDKHRIDPECESA